MVPPRFTFDRKSEKWTCNKPFTQEEIDKLQAAVLVKQTELHPEIFKDALPGKGSEEG